MRHTSSLSITALIFIWNSCVKAPDLENEVKKQQQGLRGSQRGGRKMGRRRNVRQQWARVFEDKMKNQMNFEGTGRKGILKKGHCCENNCTTAAF